jgi:hypothetical protein
MQAFRSAVAAFRHWRTERLGADLILARRTADPSQRRIEDARRSVVFPGVGRGLGGLMSTDTEATLGPGSDKRRGCGRRIKSGNILNSLLVTRYP